MPKCKDGEHIWIVIEWVKGTYHEGQFQPGMMSGGNPSYRAQVFMCQKCLTRKTMNDIEVAAYVRQQQN